MSRTVIHVEGLGKRYRIGQGARHNALSHLIGDALRAPVRLLRGRSNHSSGANGGSAVAGNAAASASARTSMSGGSPFIWALKDVSFEVKEGEVVGLIGRNGAGKSTLLKILARITRPTEGHAEIRGRVGSLLEVGTGFHPELTGRENVFMSGAVLGMRAAEIRRKFDEIVAFSEVERFLDTPLKHFSSGMQVRLAFAVAAHLEPEILFIDEVLAVGDASFQKKCLGKMGDISKQGRTIVFVSHNLSAINTLCSRAILLDGGKVFTQGATSDVVSAYYADCFGAVSSDGDLRNVPRSGTGAAVFTSIKLQPLAPRGVATEVVRAGCSLRIELEIEPRQTISDVCVDLTINDPAGYRLVDVSTGKKATYLDLRAGKPIRVEFLLHELLLKPGSYMLDIWMGRQWIDCHDWVLRAAMLEVAPDVESSNSAVVWPGPYACRFESSVSPVAVSAD
jgi:lipopolysaccharide transport system ATP-binding protein